MAQFQINNDLIDAIKSLIEKDAENQLKTRLKGVHHADIAEILDHLNPEEATYVVKLLDSERTSGALSELDEDTREGILENLSIKEIVSEVIQLDTDDAADLISELSEEMQEQVISKIPDHKYAWNIRELLKYDENTAGGLMAKELVKVQKNLNVFECLNEIRRQAERITRVHSIYVVDERDRLIGRLSLKDLVAASSKLKVAHIYIPEVDFVTYDQSGEEVAKIMSKYNLEAIPVVDEKKRLLGRITIDDVVDVIKKEADKDYQLAAGISSDVEADDSVVELAKARFPWLFLGLLGGLGSVFILQGFEEVMSQPRLRNLFFYTPLIAAMAGNAGVQSSAIVVQGLANDSIKGSLFSRLLKEIGLSLINGIALALILILFGFIFKQKFFFSVTVAVSMIVVIIVSALIGTLVPIVLDKRKIDPAIATGPFITTCNDIFGIFLFFHIVKSALEF